MTCKGCTCYGGVFDGEGCSGRGVSATNSHPHISSCQGSQIIDAIPTVHAHLAKPLQPMPVCVALPEGAYATQQLTCHTLPSPCRQCQYVWHYLLLQKMPMLPNNWPVTLCPVPADNASMYGTTCCCISCSLTELKQGNSQNFEKSLFTTTAVS